MNIEHKDINEFVKQERPGFFLSNNIFKEAFKLLFNSSPNQSNDLSSDYIDTNSHTSIDTNNSIPHPEKMYAIKNYQTKNIVDNSNPLNILNVGTGIDLSIKELAEKIAKIVNFKGQIKWDTSKPDGCPKKQLDITRINALGWKANIQLDTGLKLAYEDFLINLKESKLRS